MRQTLLPALLALLIIGRPALSAEPSPLAGAGQRIGALLSDPFGDKPVLEAAPAPAQPTVKGEPAELSPLLRRITISGDERQTRILRGALRDLFDSPTASALISRYITEGRAMTLHFSPRDGSLIQLVNGSPVISGVEATYRDGDEHPSTKVNELFLKTAEQRGISDEQLSRELAPLLAHEILGHALEASVARSKGLIGPYRQYRENETNASLVGWLVAAELKQPLDDGALWTYMANPDQYYAENALIDYGYAAGLARREFGQPVEAYRRKVTALKERRGEIDRWPGSLNGQLEAIDHFISEHGRTSAEFQLLTREILFRRDQLAPLFLKTNQDVTTRLEELIDEVENDPSSREQLAKAASTRQFLRWDEVIEAHRAALEPHLRGRSHEGERTPRPAGQVSREELNDMIEKDKKENPDHWSGR